jgi:hypothetical protein
MKLNSTIETLKTALNSLLEYLALCEYWDYDNPINDKEKELKEKVHAGLSINIRPCDLSKNDIEKLFIHEFGRSFSNNENELVDWLLSEQTNLEI